MNLLRQPPFPLSVTYEGLDPSTDYLLEIYNDKSVLLYSLNVTSDGSGVVTEDLPVFFSKYDNKYSLYIYSLVTVSGEDVPEEVKVIDTLTIERPYVNPYNIGETEDEDLQAIYHERIARNIIDVVTGGFYYKDDTLEITALGGDFLTVPNRINRINQVYRNNVKVYDRLEPVPNQESYYISPDNSAISIAKAGEYNRMQSKPVTLPLAASDSFNLYSDTTDPIAALTRIREFDLFPNGFDYLVYGEFGWPVVPQDIQDATKMLIDDLACNKLNYVSQYIKEYKTDQFTIKYDDLAVLGTGNKIVDQILSSYHINFYKAGVL
jgi:hypothetical protein